MNISNKELKFRARRSLWGSYGSLAGIQLLTAAVSFILFWAVYFFLFFAILAGGIISSVFGGAVSSLLMIGGVGEIFVLYIAAAVLVGMLGAGYCRIFLDLSLGLPMDTNRIFFAFQNSPLRFAGLTGFIFLLGFLMAVPQLIYEFSFRAQLLYGELEAFWVIFRAVLFVLLELNFAMAYFILLENPEKTVFQCLRESVDMMRGNKLRLLGLQISFAGWYALMYLSFGIGCLWAVPYVGCTITHFYLDLRERRRLLAIRKRQEEAGEQIWNP